MAADTATPCMRCRQMNRIPADKLARRQRETERESETKRATADAYDYGVLPSGPPAAMVWDVRSAS